MVEKKQKKKGYPARFFLLWLTDPLLMIFNVREMEIPPYQPLTLYLHCFPYYCLSMVPLQNLKQLAQSNVIT